MKVRNYIQEASGHYFTDPIEEEISNLLRVAMESDEFVVEEG